MFLLVRKPWRSCGATSWQDSHCTTPLKERASLLTWSGGIHNVFVIAFVMIHIARFLPELVTTASERYQDRWTLFLPVSWTSLNLPEPSQKDKNLIYRT